jgi:hypothetical protein
MTKLYSISEAARILSQSLGRRIVPRSLHRSIKRANVDTVVIGNSYGVTMADARKAALAIREIKKKSDEKD